VPKDATQAGRERISVIVPAYNRRGSILRAIQSALGQSLAPHEVIVVDDGSTDGTADVVEALAAEEPRVRLLRAARNRGGAAARNMGITEAGGELLAFLDSDDEWTDRHLERSVSVLRRDPACALVFGAFVVRDVRRRHVQPCQALEGDTLEYLFYGRGGLRTSTFVAHRDRVRQVMFDESLMKHQDWDLVVNLRRRFAIVADPAPTTILHVGGSDRLSAKPDPASSLQFYRKNRAHCSQTGWVLFFTVMLETTFRAAGRDADFRRYLELVGEVDGRAGPAIGKLAVLLSVPRVGRRLFRAAARSYCHATAGRRDLAAT
jgi:glycosyltransferase involved in cell wall biosynthesis